MIEIIIILIIISILFGDRIKGAWGELRLKLKIKLWLNDEYKLISNSYFKTSFGTTQIDHILITPKGILVIEIKNYGNVDIHGFEKAKTN